MTTALPVTLLGRSGFRTTVSFNKIWVRSSKPVISKAACGSSCIMGPGKHGLLRASDLRGDVSREHSPGSASPGLCLGSSTHQLCDLTQVSPPFMSGASYLADWLWEE